MMEAVLLLSLCITGIYVSFQSGMIFGDLRAALASSMDKALGKKVSRYIQKPLWDCLPCMASIWVIILTWGIDVLLILAVCGLNALIDSVFISHEPVADE